MYGHMTTQYAKGVELIDANELVDTELLPNTFAWFLKEIFWI